jgi:hypothetical protein
VEFDGPSHFLASRSPTGATLLKRRHLTLLGYQLVSVPYWEWEKVQGHNETEQAYLRDKLDVALTGACLSARPARAPGSLVAQAQVGGPGLPPGWEERWSKTRKRRWSKTRKGPSFAGPRKETMWLRPAE